MSRRVGEGFRGFEECFGGFYKAGEDRKSRGGGAILGGVVKENSLGLCLMCFEIKNAYQKSSLLKVYLGRSKYGG